MEPEIWIKPTGKQKKILDVTCGDRTIWFQKHEPHTIYCDKRLRRFDDMLTQASKDYAEVILDDVQADKRIEYAKATLDRELQQYVGSMFVPWEERYR